MNEGSDVCLRPVYEEFQRVPPARAISLRGRTGTVNARAIAAQFVPAAEIHWSVPCGNSESKAGWKAIARVRANHGPSRCW